MVRAIIYGLLALIFIILMIAVYSTVPVENPWPAVVFGLPAFYLGRLSYRHFKPRYSVLTEKDLGHQAPVLFLRPFDEDSGWDGAAAFSAYNPRTWRKFFLILSPSNLTALYLELTGRTAFEQVLAHVVRKIGPLVAIGEPGSPSILGALNLYVGDDDWQNQVRDLAARSSLIVLTSGHSAGVLWEVKTMVEQSSAEKFLLNIAGSSRKERDANYAEFYPLAAPLFPSGLPETVKGERFLSFEEGWIPRTEKVARPVKDSPTWVANTVRKLLL
jgi:hypothetical protein